MTSRMSEVVQRERNDWANLQAKRDTRLNGRRRKNCKRYLHKAIRDWG